MVGATISQVVKWGPSDSAMANSFLRPPTNHRLSDAVIGDVVPRVVPIQGRVGRRILTDQRWDHEMGPNANAGQAVNHRELCLINSTIVFVSPNERQWENSIATDFCVSAAPPTPVRKRHVSRARRERCRLNQAKYRERQRKYTETLEKVISERQQEIRELDTQLQSLQKCVSTSKTLWAVATEYFRLFRHGYMTPQLTPKVFSSSSLPSTNGGVSGFQCCQPHVQLDYLRAIMVHNATEGKGCGAKAVLNQWKLLTVSFDDVHVQLTRLEEVHTNSLVATTTTSVTITLKTLQNVFPHLIVRENSDAEDEEECKSTLSPLGDKLLNQRLSVVGSVQFDWDPSRGRLMRLESKMDLLTTLLRLLGSIEDVTTVFDNAMISLEGRFTHVGDRCRGS